MQNLGFRNGRRIQWRPVPGNLQRKFGVVHHAPVATVATQVVRGPHEDAIYRTGFHAKRAEHAFRVVDREAGYLEAFAIFNPFFADVNAVDRKSLGAACGPKVVAQDDAS